jgi:hypothetical protein
VNACGRDVTLVQNSAKSDENCRVFKDLYFITNESNKIHLLSVCCTH